MNANSIVSFVAGWKHFFVHSLKRPPNGLVSAHRARTWARFSHKKRYNSLQKQCMHGSVVRSVPDMGAARVCRFFLALYSEFLQIFFALPSELLECLTDIFCKSSVQQRQAITGSSGDSKDFEIIISPRVFFPLNFSGSSPDGVKDRKSVV